MDSVAFVSVFPPEKHTIPQSFLAGGNLHIPVHASEDFPSNQFSHAHCAHKATTVKKALAAVVAG